MLEPRTKKGKASEESTATSKKFEAGTYLGLLPRACPVIPTVACAMLSPQHTSTVVMSGSGHERLTSWLRRKPIHQGRSGRRRVASARRQ